MRKIISICLILCFSSFVHAEESYEKAQELSKYINKEFGVSPNALFYLIQYDDNSYLPLEAYKMMGYYKYFEELEKNGYIKIHIVTSMPDGRKMGEQIQPVPTLKGWGVKNGLAPQQGHQPSPTS
jgi:hypothetical protein